MEQPHLPIRVFFYGEFRLYQRDLHIGHKVFLTSATFNFSLKRHKLFLPLHSLGFILSPVEHKEKHISFCKKMAVPKLDLTSPKLDAVPQYFLYIRLVRRNLHFLL